MDVKYSNIGSEPVTVDEVKNYLRIDYTDDDSLISDLITGCRELAEEFTGLSLVVKTIELRTNDYDNEFALPFPDHNELLAVEQDGSDILSNCQTSGTNEIIIKLPANYVSYSIDDNDLYVKYTTSGNCPKGIKLAILKNIHELFDNRRDTNEIPQNELTQNTYVLLSKFVKV